MSTDDDKGQVEPDRAVHRTMRPPTALAADDVEAPNYCDETYFGSHAYERGKCIRCNLPDPLDPEDLAQLAQVLRDLPTYPETYARLVLASDWLAADRRTGAAKDSLVERLRAQREWSTETFGPGDRYRAILDHLHKELLEVRAEPRDVEEWIDVAILALDGAWRTGATPEQVVAALDAKYAKNRARIWPDWRTADPDKAIEHVARAAQTERGE